MSRTKPRLFPDRVDFTDNLTKAMLLEAVKDATIEVMQCVQPVALHTWQLLDEEFFTRRPDVQLRVYGFYAQVCDLSFVSMMTNVRHFSADCLMDAQHVESIAEMDKLESLGVGVFNLESFEFLNQVTPQLKKLFLGATRSKKPDLSPLSRFQSLEHLYLEGQQKNIEVLSQLAHLQDVTLRSISTADLGYLRLLQRMWSLDVKLGGIKDFSAIEGMEHIKYLELWQIRGLSDLGFVSGLTGLQYLFLQALAQVRVMPSFRRLNHLRRIYMENMKGLRDISSLEHAPALEELVLVSMTKLQPEDSLPVLRNANLKRISGWLGSFRKNDRFNELAREHGIEAAKRLDTFQFR